MSNGNCALAERPNWDGSGIASITPVIVVSIEFPITTVLPTGSPSPNSLPAASRVSTALRGNDSAERSSPATNGKLKMSRNSGSTAMPNNRTAWAPFATIVLRSITTARAILAMAG